MRHAVLLFSISICACAPMPPLLVEARGEGEACSLRVGGVEMSGDETYQAKLKSLAVSHGRRTVIDTDEKTPYRCVGGAVFNLQRAGFRHISLTLNGVPFPAQNPPSVRGHE